MQNTQATGFEALHVAPALCKRLLQHNITIPTPIQELAIPVASGGHDLIGIAQTGTGKTLGFALPMIQRLQQGEVGLVLAPTRELAQQIAETFHKLDCSTVLVIGGAPMNRQMHQLRGRYSVIVATPGRLQDHLDQGNVRLDRVAIAVLDEADRMLDMGFAPQIKRILDKTPKNRQTLLFSATMPREIADLAAHYLREPKRVEADRSGTAAELVVHELIVVDFEDKQPLLKELLAEHDGSVLVFARTRHGARKLAKAVRAEGHSAAELHADRTFSQRRTALQGFKNGEFRVLVATDIAARGIDVKEISLVINYDVPEKAEDYVHRIGRTGRAGATGRAITIAIPSQSNDVRDIERLLGNRLPVTRRAPVARPAEGSARPALRVATPAVHRQPAPAPRPARVVTAASNNRQGKKNQYWPRPRRRSA